MTDPVTIDLTTQHWTKDGQTVVVPIEMDMLNWGATYIKVDPDLMWKMLTDLGYERTDV